MMITKAMLARCQNEKHQAFDALDEDVREAMFANREHVEYYNSSGQWVNRSCSANTLYISNVYRLSPNTPCEPEWLEYQVGIVESGVYGISSGCAHHGEWLSRCVINHKFLGIIYRDAAGVETLRTTIDRAFGVPVRVRFEK